MCELFTSILKNTNYHATLLWHYCFVIYGDMLLPKKFIILIIPEFDYLRLSGNIKVYIILLQDRYVTRMQSIDKSGFVVVSHHYFHNFTKYVINTLQ